MWFVDWVLFFVQRNNTSFEHNHKWTLKQLHSYSYLGKKPNGWPTLHCGPGYIFSNVKKGCLKDDNIFEVVRKI